MSSFTLVAPRARLTAQLSELSAGMSRRSFADGRFGYRLLSSRARLSQQQTIKRFPAPIPVRSMATATRPTTPRVDSVMERRDSGNASAPYEAVVVGAGPAGITAMGNLLEKRIEPILWVDEEFGGGRVNKFYREVPSNTKVKLFVEFAMGTEPFRRIVEGSPDTESAGDAIAKTDLLQDLRKLDQEKGCHLSHAADMCLMLTEGLKNHPSVDTQQGRVSEAVLDDQTSTWDISLSNFPTSIQTKRLILCTGSSPNDPPLPYEPPQLKHVDLDVALSPTRLSQLLSPLGPTTVAVIGASHSAVLVLWNLCNLALSSKPDLRIQWFTRHPLRYAEYEKDFIARDNTGLKGEAATWARENLEPNAFPHSPINKVLTPISYPAGSEESIYREHLHSTSYVIQAIGYTPNPLPSLKLSSGQEIKPFFDHTKGIFNYVKESPGGDVVQLPGVYGAGIAWPEKVVDRKYGHEEMNVGFFKFMKAVRRWREGWHSADSISA